jgi:hypothetical protein
MHARMHTRWPAAKQNRSLTLCWPPQGPASMNSQMGQPGVDTSEVGASPAAATPSSMGCGAVGAEGPGVSDILTGSIRAGNGPVVCIDQLNCAVKAI